MVKHFENGDCGVRPFLDLWLLNKNLSYNQTEKEKLLMRCRFSTFAEASERLAMIWFDNQEMDDLCKELQFYILTGGVYGTLQNRVSVQQVKKGSKFKYILSRIFISNKDLKIKYPKLEKHPWMAPFYHVKRWLKPLTQKKSRQASLTELSEASSVEETEKMKSEYLLLQLGLK